MKIRSILVLLFVMTTGLPAAQAYRFGTGVRVSSFGVPNALLDLAFFEHPQLAGMAYAFELQSYGDKGPQSVFSGIYSLEYSHIYGEGNYRIERGDRRFFGAGEITQLSATATVLMHVFPSSPIHPYIGAGIGIGHLSIWAEGSYQDELGTTIRDSFQRKMFVPVGHIPIGVMANIRDKFLLRAEAGFKNGFYFGGSVTINF